MRLRFEDGWPFRHPRIFVDGMTTEHVNAQGEVCLWQEGDPSRQWTALAAFERRVTDWVAAAELGFPDDPTLDAHLYFTAARPGFATLDLAKLTPRGMPGYKGRVGGSWSEGETVLALAKPSQGGDVKGSWYFVDLAGAPPRNLDSLREVLSVTQRRDFAARLRDVAAGEERVVVLIWERGGARNALVVCLREQAGRTVAEAIEVAPMDTAYLAQRAGPDFDLLQTKSVVIFGLGAIGSNLALRLAECGIAKLTLIDGEMLRPSNVVRHVAPRSAVGWNKAEAVALLTPERVPWTKVTHRATRSWDPATVTRYVRQGDLVIDATGVAGFSHMLSVICEEEERLLVSVALFRGGAVARVRRQVREEDTPIYGRVGDERYPQIPPGEERVALEPGCSSPVNNASPAAVAAAAALAEMVVADALTERYEHGDEIIDVYRPLETAPFDRLGRVSGD